MLPAGAFAQCFGAPTLASAAVVVTDPRGYGPRWVAGAGADHSFPRLSTLVVVDVVAERFVHLYDRIDVTAEIGLRHQLAPQLVVDLGVGRHFLGTLLSTSATLGLSYGMPLFVRVGPRDAAPARAADARAPAFVRVADEQTYLPRDHNWTFRRRYPAADRLLNAFDYGHAILYETLITAGSDAPRRLDGPVRRFVIDHVLAPGEPVPLEERAIGPRYATLAPELLATFAWAHQLHRQVYDVLADEWLGPADKDSAVAELLRYYRSRPDLALSSRPKSMMLMEGQPFSTEFRHASPMYNGLIWSYHWMQMALYDALLRGADVHERARLVDSTVARFRAMAMGNGLRMPMVMPMSAAVAPDFSARYPEAAIIFDNLHSLHDVVSDILISPLVPAREKRRQLLAAAASYRDDVTAVTTRAEWAEMARSMDVNMMGGVAVPETRQP